MVGQLQEKYGVSREEADKRLEEWRNSLPDEERVRASGSQSRE